MLMLNVDPVSCECCPIYWNVALSTAPLIVEMLAASHAVVGPSTIDEGGEDNLAFSLLKNAIFQGKIAPEWSAGFDNFQSGGGHC